MTTEPVRVQDEWRIDYRRLDSMWVLTYALTGWSMGFRSRHEAIDAMEIYAKGLCLA